MKQAAGAIAVEGKHIVKNFCLGGTTTEVLRDLSVQIMRGEFVSVMGPSGSGKSTLLYILGGLDTPTGGQVLLDGEDLSQLGDEQMSRFRRRKIGFVFQFYNLIPNLNVEENIMLPQLLDGRKAADCRERLDELLETVGLADRRRYTPRELSGGQQQRVAIARALMGSPRILFADEPTGNLDSSTGAGIMSLLRRINRESGQTIIMVTHSPEAAGYGERLITVQDGRIIL